MTGASENLLFILLRIRQNMVHYLWFIKTLVLTVFSWSLVTITQPPAPGFKQFFVLDQQRG